jgi:hypothetical protein
MYYGGVGQAAYGSLIILMVVAPFVALLFLIISGVSGLALLKQHASQSRASVVITRNK